MDQIKSELLLDSIISHRQTEALCLPFLLQQGGLEVGELAKVPGLDLFDPSQKSLLTFFCKYPIACSLSPLPNQ